MHKVVITGITGFLGSHIAEALIMKGVYVIGIKRSGSDVWRCTNFFDKVDWIDIHENDNWKAKVIERKPNVIIHCAWIGVEATQRDDWNVQIENINLLMHIIDICSSIKLKKFIFLGSQAEYGKVMGKIDESFEVLPNNAYGSVKLACLQILKSAAKIQNFDWLWLRVFSVFGERENDNWLIPSLIKAMVTSEEMNFTEGEQKYAYLYVRDFSEIISIILKSDIRSDIYNISSNQLYKLRTVIEMIKENVNPDFILNFGAIPYRVNQSMHIEGDSDKLIREIGPFPLTDFSLALSNTIRYYTSKY